jgi:hypothetical protein
MAKKKKTTKKKAKKKKSTKKKSTKQKAQTKTSAKNAGAALAKIVGVTECLLCEGRPMRTLDEFEKHLYEEHGGITLAEYRKVYPKSRKNFDVDPEVLSMDQVHRGITHFVKYGKWPHWFDATKKVDIGAADEMLIRIFASQVIEAQQDRMLGIMRYLNIALKRTFSAEHAATASQTAMEERARWGLSLMNQAIDAMHRTVDLVKKADTLTNKPTSRVGRATFVAAATIEEADQVDDVESRSRFKHKSTAAVSELTGAIQSFMTKGTEHGIKPPSQIIDVSVEDVTDKTGNNGDT